MCMNDLFIFLLLYLLLRNNLLFYFTVLILYCADLICKHIFCELVGYT